MFEEQTKERYKGQRGRDYHERKRAIPEEAIPWVARLRAAKFSSHLTGKEVVLEYGVGLGWNFAGLKVKRRLGFDVGDFLAPGLAQQGIEFVSDLKAIRDGSIDVIICHHTLEHLLNPAEGLREMSRLLSVEGKLLLFVPYEKEKKYKYFNREEPNHHLYSWNVQTLGNLVEELGFEVRETTLAEFGYDRFAASWAVRLKLGEIGFRWLRKLIHIFKPGREVRIVAVKKSPKPEQP